MQLLASFSVQYKCPDALCLLQLLNSPRTEMNCGNPSRRTRSICCVNCETVSVSTGPGARGGTACGRDFTFSKKSKKFRLDIRLSLRIVQELLKPLSQFRWHQRDP